MLGYFSLSYVTLVTFSKKKSTFDTKDIRQEKQRKWLKWKLSTELPDFPYAQQLVSELLDSTGILVWDMKIIRCEEKKHHDFQSKTNRTRVGVELLHYRQ